MLEYRTRLRFLHLAVVSAVLASLLWSPGTPAVAQEDDPPTPVSPEAQALEDQGAAITYNDDGRARFISFEQPIAVGAVSRFAGPRTEEEVARGFLSSYAAVFGIQAQSQNLEVLREVRAEDGGSVVHFQQTYQGVPVLGGELIVGLDGNQQVRSANGEVTPDLSLSTIPAIEADVAAQTALDITAQSHGVAVESLTVSPPELWIYDPGLIGPLTGEIQLVWRMEVTPLELAPIREFVLVNALDGSVALHFNQIDALETPTDSPDSLPTEIATETPTNNPTFTETPVPTETASNIGVTPSDVAGTDEPTGTATSQAELTPAPEEITTNLQSLETVAATWYVLPAPTGSDSNSCSTTTAPCATINGAIGKAAAGDTIRVGTGTYTGSGTEVVLISKNLTLSGGWNTGFTSQTGTSTINGQGARRGVTIGGSATVQMSKFTLQNGYASGLTAGGGLLVQTLSTVSLTSVIISGNTATAYGGGISNGGTLTVTDSTISNNLTPNYDGGGIYNASPGSLTIVSSTLVNNQAGRYGGGIYTNQASLTIKNSTLSGNMSLATDGGGLYIASGTVLIENSTIAGNSADDRGGGIFAPSGPIVTIRNTILARNENLWAAQASPDCFGSIGSAGYNLIGNTTGCTFSSQTGDQLNPVDPGLGPLQNNGGPTLTHALLTGSPALDAGNPSSVGSGGNACLAVDQRGVARPVNGRCDIGAFEGSTTGVTFPLLRTYTANNSTSLPGSLLCNQSQSACTNGANSDGDKAHKYAFDTYNFYATNFGRDSLDDNGLTMVSSVHYSVNYANAGWTGTQMLYGDNYAGADDVVGHELTHGVTQYESNLIYYYQPGAINEAFSDIFGEFVDLTNGSGNDAANVRWLMGEDLPGGAIRSMQNPPQFSDPDKMTSTYYYTGSSDNGGVHTNSGIANKAAYLLADGGTFNGYTVTALGILKTAHIFYEAQTTLLTSGSDYGDLYTALYQACQNLAGGEAGITVFDCIEVRDATNATEMNLQPVSNFNAEAPICASGLVPSNLFFDGFEAGTGNWTLTALSGTNRWSLDTQFAHSGILDLMASDNTTGAANSPVTMATSVSLQSNSYLRFSHVISLASADGGYLEYSTNGGSTWTDAAGLPKDNGYAAGSKFTGVSHGYISSRYDLSSLGTASVRFRWRLNTDATSSNGAWFLDDVQIYKCVTDPMPPTFNDVPADYWAHDYIEALYDAGYTSGCSTSPPLFCPDQTMTRAESAVFVVRGIHNSAYLPTTPATPQFNDTPVDQWYTKWAQQLYVDGYTSGCSSSPPLFCPLQGHTRAEGSVFYLRMLYGASYTPAQPTQQRFADVPLSQWYAKWAEAAYLADIIEPCETTPALKFCPDGPLTRALAAYMMVKAKNLPLP